MGAFAHKLELMGYQEDTFVLQGSKDSFVKDLIGHFRIDSGQGVIQQIDVSILVDSSGQADSCLLASGDVDASFTDNSFLTLREEFHIRLHAADLNALFEALFIVLETKCHILLNRARKDEGLLFNVCDFSLDAELALHPAILLHDREEQGRLARSDLSRDHH